MSNRFLAIVIAVIIGFFGIIYVTKKKSHPAQNGSTTSNAQTSNNVEGNLNAKVTLTEYGDFQCPACKQYFPVVEQVVDKYKADIKFQFKNFPLAQIHQHAFEGARAAQAASKQGKFWEMYRMLYENQTTWISQNDPSEAFNSYASQLGLNLDQFKKDYASSETNDIINADLQEATRLGANSTPTFVLNGKRVEQNPQSAEAFDKMIADAIAASKK